MINLLVVDDNFNYSKNLINIILKENPKIRLYNYCTNGKEVIDIINNQSNNIDIILLDLKLPTLDGVEVLTYLEKNNFTEYKKSIIVISSEIELMLKIRNNPYLYTIINKTSGFEKIIAELKELANTKENEKNSIEYKIYQELKKLHYNFSYIGTQYLLETIELLYNDSNIENIRLEKDIYPIIAKKYNKRINNIKTNIINASDLMYYDCNIEIINQYFGINNDEKPTPKLIIITILNKLKYNL